jgi:hypothetical protein
MHRANQPQICILVDDYSVGMNIKCLKTMQLGYIAVLDEYCRMIEMIAYRLNSTTDHRFYN